MDEKKLNLWMFLVISFIVGIVIGGGLVFILKGGSTGADSVSLYPPKSGSDWLIKIDDYVITKSEYEEGFKYFLNQIPEAQRANLPPDTKKLYFDNLLSQYIITIKALNEGLAKSKEGQLLLKTAIRQAVYQIYISKNLPADKSAFYPSKIEIDDYYLKNKAQFDRMGLKTDQIKQYATQELSQQKMQLWVQGFVAQMKENFKVLRNNDLLQQEGISLQQQNNQILTLPPATNK